MEGSVFEAAGGRPGIQALAAAWHRRCLADPVVSHAFSHGVHDHHVDRLAAYWAEALGGPSGYTGALGDQSQVLRMHSGNGEHEDMDLRARGCFAQALNDAGVSDDTRLRQTLVNWFEWSTSLMASHPNSPDDVPANLPLPRWSWHGPV